MENKKKILIIDDSKGWLDNHEQTLRNIFGDEFVLEKAASAREGYNVIYNNLYEPFCLILSDLQMEMDFEPKHAGEWFIAQVQNLKQYNNTPIIIISAAYNIRSIAQKLGVNCLPKAIAARDLNSYKLAVEELLK